MTMVTLPASLGVNHVHATSSVLGTWVAFDPTRGVRSRLKQSAPATCDGPGAWSERDRTPTLAPQPSCTLRLGTDERSTVHTCDFCARPIVGAFVEMTFQGWDPSKKRINAGGMHYHTAPGTHPTFLTLSCYDGVIAAVFDFQKEARDAVLDDGNPFDPPATDRMEETTEEPTPTPNSTRTFIEEVARAKSAWKAVTKEERERVAIEVVGNDALTMGEISERFSERLPDCSVYEGYVRPIVTRLWQSGQFDRRPETFRKTRTRYRYFRKALSGPIAELERQFTEEA